MAGAVKADAKDGATPANVSQEVPSRIATACVSLSHEALAVFAISETHADGAHGKVAKVPTSMAHATLVGGYFARTAI